MSSALKNARVVDAVLTEYARGYTQNELIGLKLFPSVPLDKEAARVPKFGRESFKNYNTERAIRAKSNRINPTDYEPLDVITKEHDLEFPVDYREENEAIMSKERHATRVTTEAILLKHEILCAALATNADNYPSGHKVSLTTTACWDDAVNSDPVGDVLAGKKAIRAKIGKNPNTLILGAGSFEALQVHTKIQELIKYTRLGVPTLDDLKAIFKVKNIFIGEAVVSNDKETAITDVWGDVAILAFVNDSPEATEYDPSFAYTYKRKGFPQVDKRLEDGKINVIRTTDFFEVKICGSEAGYLIANTIA